ncbi:hypothetical protein HPB50_029429 [Hyalomma asiaticum]|nr:hypothetical protein HPB50_029429 [Hyalomma asiaticum]
MSPRVALVFRLSRSHMGLFSTGFSSLRTQQGSPTTERGALSNLRLYYCLGLTTSTPVAGGGGATTTPKISDAEDFPEDNANDGSGRVGATSGRRIPALRRKVLADSRMPQLPEEHQKIIVRPRNGQDLRNASHYGVSTAIFRAEGISRMEADTDLVCPNIVHNIVVICMEKESNAKKLY